MNNAVFLLKHRGVTVTFTPEARRWCVKNVGVLHEVAEEAALKWKGGVNPQPMVHPGVVVAALPSHKTSWDTHGGASMPQPTKPVVAHPQTTKPVVAQKPAKVSDKTEDEFEPVEVQPRRGDIMRHAKDGCSYFALADGVHAPSTDNFNARWQTKYHVDGACLFTCRDGSGYRIVKRVPAAKPESGVADVVVPAGMEGARVFRFTNGNTNVAIPGITASFTRGEKIRCWRHCGWDVISLAKAPAGFETPIEVHGISARATLYSLAESACWNEK